MFHDSYGDTEAALKPFNLPLALCSGDPSFTRSVGPEEAARCIALCQVCPELEPCRVQHSLYRTSVEWRHADFNGIWAGVRYSRSRPSQRVYKRRSA